MKKILKSRIFIFILGMVIASTITAYATLSLAAEDVTYGASTVKSALDTLYTKVKPAYTGSTSVTPTTTQQTLNTANTILDSNITVGAIPSTYKNLTTSTTVASNKLLTGITAYDNLGNLITGNISTDCISGSINTSDGYNTSTDKLVTSIKPKKFMIYTNSNVWSGGHFWIEGWTTFVDVDWGAAAQAVTIDQPLSRYYTINDNGFSIHSWPAGYTMYYMACK